jgi:hypothetical protein
MIEEEFANNLTMNLTGSLGEVVSTLPPELAAPVATLIMILQAVGVLFFVYIIFLIVNSVLAIRRNLFAKKTWKKIQEIEKKLDKVLKINKKEKKKK